MLASLCLLALAPAIPHAAPGVGADRPFESFAEAARWVQTTNGGVARNRVQPRVISEGPDFWYRIDTGPKTAEFVLVRPGEGARHPAFDHDAVAAAISRRGGEPVTGKTLPFRVIEYPDGPTGPVRFSARGARWEVDGSEVREVDRSDAGDGGAGPQSENVQWLDRPRSDLDVGGRTTVTFVNQTDGPLTLFWLNGRRETSYGQVAAGADRDMGTYAGHVWLVKNAGGTTLAALAGTDAPGRAIIAGPDPRFSDAGAEDSDDAPRAAEGPRQTTIILRRGNVVHRPSDRPLTDADGESVPEGYERISYRGPLLVSPDGRTVLVTRVTVAPVRKIRIAPASEADRTVEPFRISYPKPGDLRDLVQPVFFDTDSGERVDVPTDQFADPYSLNRWRWSADGSEVYFLHNPRGHRELQILAAHRETGAVRVVVEERPDSFVDYSQKTEFRWLSPEEANESDGPETFLWASERSGWNHLYRIEAGSGDVLNAVTSGDWVVRGVEKIEDGRVWFVAGGIVPGQDPYYKHLCRVNLDGTDLVVLTSDDREPGDGTHEWTFSDDGRYLFDRFSRVDLPPVTILRDAETGALICELERADPAARLATGWRPPERFVAKGRDCETDIYGTVIFPPGFDPDTADPGSLPIIENIYAGPHGAFVAKSWGTSRHARELAALGFAVVRCDGMGTNWRSKAFHDVAWRNVGDSGFPDRVLFIQALAEKYPALDTNRVGIYGGSAGGQSAMRALLSHNDFYKAAAADCGCHDNRIDKMWWNEAWMGKVGPHYDDSSNIRDAPLMEGELLLTLGGSDRNVDPACTYDTADALRAAGKNFTLKVYPEGGHGSGERDEARELRANFFRDALMKP
ncbi:prolyl oligopeptidase family serine peptidase [Alienimonas chondri]|uniref:S9 family peptidase n=1 Tax=Alienimonas chondri TaxID=2681879 RepID=A0ABX1VCV6_9PLAN|nr:prolyl oligopeptidase family serine peptidase [Alienimonas chondri]NNJ25945.1 hypothetical protein [Alienimonas chondri]